jgi:hypothetical protein
MPAPDDRVWSVTRVEDEDDFYLGHNGPGRVGDNPIRLTLEQAKNLVETLGRAIAEEEQARKLRTPWDSALRRVRLAVRRGERDPALIGLAELNCQYKLRCQHEKEPVPEKNDETL